MDMKDKTNASSSGAKAKKRFAGMLDLVALAASLIFILAACTTAKTEGGDQSANISPVVSESPAVPTEATAAVIPSSDPSSAILYPEYMLENKYGGPELHLGVQTGSYPWGHTFDVNDETFHTSGDMPGVNFYRFDGDQFRLFFHQIEETGKDVISTFMTTSETYKTARGIQHGDSVEKLLEAYGDSLLWQPEPFPISRDLGGTFSIYDELFIYTRPEDDNCCIVFFIASNIDSKKITGIQISLGQDGSPAYFADDVNTFAVDDMNLGKYLKKDTSDEERVHELFKAQVLDASSVLDAMTQMNWRIYGQQYPGEQSELYEWLYQLKVSEEHDILCVLKSTEGLDGALSEGYSGVLANIYRDDSLKFIRLASQLDDTNIDILAHLICYDLSMNRAQVIAELEGYEKSSDMAEKELLVIRDILRYFDLWYAD